MLFQSLWRESYSRPAFALVAAMLVILPGVPFDGASAYTLKTLYSFCAKTKTDVCTDGDSPSFGGVIVDSAGDLFGVTGDGGDWRHGPGGVVYELAYSPATGGWQYTVRYRFCAKGGCKDGSLPDGTLIADTSGNLYGLTSLGGTHNHGVVYKLTAVPGNDLWAETVLYDFCAKSACADGALAVAGLTYLGAATGQPYDGVASLFGTTIAGGANGGGTVFELSPAGTRLWHETVLHSFCAEGGAQCTDGQSPRALVTMDASGNIYGTTDVGGASGAGVIFELTPQAREWSATVLHAFCSSPNCTDGINTVAGLTMSASGDLYGTTYAGGAGNAGVAFQLVPDGGQSPYTVLHDFCATARCADGTQPFGGLAMDTTGNLYGTSFRDGRFNGGTVYRIGGDFQVLYDFCRRSNCKDGEDPASTLVANGAGRLFGTTNKGGKFGKGTVFELVP